MHRLIAGVALTAALGAAVPCHAATPLSTLPRGLLPTLLTDAAHDEGSGPDYGDIIGAGMANTGGDLFVVQRVRGSIPLVPPTDFDGYSWRFDTDLNSNTGYRQFDYIGIDWEILVVPEGTAWTVAKWSPDGGTVPLPDATLYLQHAAGGDYVGVRFAAEEIGRPPYLNWIAWNGVPPTWEDVAPERTVAWWEH